MDAAQTSGFLHAPAAVDVPRADLVAIDDSIETDRLSRAHTELMKGPLPLTDEPCGHTALGCGGTK